MRRLLLVMIVASPLLHATSFTSATCTVGSTTQTVTGPTDSSCSLPILVDGMFESVDARATVMGMNAIAVAGGPLNATWSAAASARDIETFATAGPRRPGF